MEAIGYIRVSTTGQATDGVSLSAQRQRITAWCLATGYELIAVHVDAGVSGAKASNRPGLHAALAEAKQTKAALVIYSLSRLARSTRDAIAISESLAQSGVELVSLSERIDTTAAAGKMMFRMLAVLAEFERDIVSESRQLDQEVPARTPRPSPRPYREVLLACSLNWDYVTACGQAASGALPGCRPSAGGAASA